MLDNMDTVNPPYSISYKDGSAIYVGQYTGHYPDSLKGTTWHYAGMGECGTEYREMQTKKKETSEELYKRLASEMTKISIDAFVEWIDNRFYPTRIIYNPPYTICYFGEEKVIVKCSEFDEFKPDFGVMACIMRRLFDTRADFERLVDSGSWQEPKEKKDK